MLGALLGLSLLASAQPTGSSLLGDIRMHDPSTVVTCNGKFWVFATGRGISVHSSVDGKTWRREPPIFTDLPPEMHAAVPLNRDNVVWAPDVAKLNGEYYLYYSVSSWGSEVSAIGLVTSPTLDPSQPGYRWTDRGIVVQSRAKEWMNTIDPCIFHAPDGTLWLTYGSYIGTVDVVQLDPKTGLRPAGPDAPAPRPLSSHSEASAMIFHDGWCYLFVNRGSCCQHEKSTYHIMVGRARAPTGPFLDDQGKDLLKNGGRMFLASEPGKIGPGHFGLLEEDGGQRFSLHYEADPTRHNQSVLDIRPLAWTPDGWPTPGA